MLGQITEIPNKLLSWINLVLLQQKLNNPLGYLVILGIVLFSSAVVTLLGLEIGVLLVGLVIGTPILLLSFIDLRVGMGLILVIAFMINFIAKYSDAPIGIALDGLLFLLLLSVIVQGGQRKDWYFPHNPITVIILVWLAYNLLMAFHPEAASRTAWVFTVRSYAIQQILFFIACYALKNIKDIKKLIQVIIFLAFISALYGMKQEYFGYSAREWAWLYERPNRYTLIVQWNRYRAFSFFSDPTTFGTLMAYMGIFCFILATGSFKWWKRGGLLVAGFCMFLSMAYAGSRTPFVLVPLALVFYVLITMKKEVLIGGALMLMVGTVFVLKSTSNPVIFRIQSAFRPTKDASVQVRLENQRIIQPYIRTHPIGAGLGSTGVWGERFSPHTWLAGFAHDSAFVRVAVEMGWIGLIIYLIYFFIVMRVTLYYYFRVRDPVIRTIYQALAVTFFLVMLASYPQEVITILPTSMIFYIFLAIVVRLKDFDQDFEHNSVE